MDSSAILTLITAIITGGLSLVGVIVTNTASNAKFENRLQVSQAITNTKLEGLTEEVRKQNSMFTKIPVIEQRVDDLKHRVDKIEEKIKH